MNFFEKIASEIKEGKAPYNQSPSAVVPPIAPSAPAPSMFSRIRGGVLPLLQPFAYPIVDRMANKSFADSAIGATGGNAETAAQYLSDPVGGALVNPETSSKVQSASDRLALTRGGAFGALPLLGGIKPGLGYAAFYGLDPLAQRGLEKVTSGAFSGALGKLPEDQRLSFWQRFADPAQAEALKSENPDVFANLSKIQSNSQTANEVRGSIFDQWRGAHAGPIPLHSPSTENIGGGLALKGTGSVLSRLGLSGVGNSLKGIAATNPAKSWNMLMPNPAMLARGAGAGVATWGANKVNSLAGGIGAPAKIDPVTGNSQYDSEHPWWHDSLRGMRSSVAGAVGGAPLGPVGAITGAVMNPINEVMPDLKEIGSSWKSRLFDEDPLAKQNRMIEDSRRAWQTRETAARYDADVAKGQEESKNFMKSFSNYRTALGIGVGVPLAGLLLYRMFARKKQKPKPEEEPAQAEYESPELA